MNFIKINPGKFLMGSNEYNDEKPIHEVETSTTEIFKTIPGLEFYEASSFGKIRSKVTNKILKTHFKKDGYERVWISKGSNKNHSVSRLVALTFMGESSLEVDHINGVRHDNRIENLRYLNRQENQRKSNRPSFYKTNKTGCLGVRKVNKKYIAEIRVNKKRFHLGTFDNIEAAKCARKKAEEEML